ncbi:MAG: hypothetical protein CSYNP_01802 [Syntrophus sp. SKADARSKE-3]|nr:hypothetical protein [Syntrophus sp. SKADARSKE-3]
MEIINLFERIPEPLPDEHVEELLKTMGFRLERIVSRGHSSPEDFWYDQECQEWVLLLKGRAILEVAGEAAPLTLSPGDCLNIPAHCRHRLVWTDPDTETIWLTIHYDTI